MRTKTKTTKHGIKTMNELLSYLDERGFSEYEAIEFIGDSLGKELRKKVIDKVVKEYELCIPEEEEEEEEVVE